MTLGSLKFWFDRWRGYASSAQFVMVIYLFMRESGIRWWWIAGGLVLSMAFMWFDKRYIVRGEMGKYWGNNPEWQRFREQ